MRISILKGLVLAMPISAALAQTPQPFQFNVAYECPAVQSSIKIYSCAGPGAGDWCDVQTFSKAHPSGRGKSTRQQVMGLLTMCHLQTKAEADAAAKAGPAMPMPANATAAGAAQAGPGGFKVGDRVRVLIDGWQEGKVIQIRGNTYVVHLDNGLDVPKIWPIEVRKIGKLTDAEHALGQYDLHDHVAVLMNGRWMEGDVVGQDYNRYTVRLPGPQTMALDGDRTVTTTPENLRPAAAPAAPAQRAVGQPPKPGFKSCAGKYEGRYELSAGMEGMKVVFRSGKATVTEGLGGEMAFECFIDGDKIVLYKAGSFTPFSYGFDINNDGTLQSPLGEIKKKGN